MDYAVRQTFITCCFIKFCCKYLWFAEFILAATDITHATLASDEAACLSSSLVIEGLFAALLDQERWRLVCKKLF